MRFLTQIVAVITACLLAAGPVLAQSATSPGSTTGAPDIVTSPVTINDVNDTVTIALNGREGVTISIAAGTLDATLAAEVSGDGSTNWSAATIVNLATGLTVTEVDLDNPNDAAQYAVLWTGAASHIRVKVSSFVSGAADVHLRAMANRTNVLTYGVAKDGTGYQPILLTNTTPVGTEWAPIFRCLGCTSTGGTSAPDNTVWVYGTTAVTPMGAVYDTTPGTVTDGNVGFVRRNDKGDLHVFPVKPDGSASADANGWLASITTVVSTQGYNRRNSGTLGSLNAVVAVDTSGAGSVGWEVDTGTLAGTVVFEGTYDNSTWFGVNAIELGGTNPGKMLSRLTSFGRRGHFRHVGFQQARLRVSAYTSGTSNARLEVSLGPSGINPSVINCVESKVISTAASGNTAIVAALADETVYICGWDFIANGTTNVKLLDGTGGTCGGGSPIDLTPTYRLTAQTGLARNAPFGGILAKATAVNREICFSNSAAVQVDALVHYARF